MTPQELIESIRSGMDEMADTTPINDHPFAWQSLMSYQRLGDAVDAFEKDVNRMGLLEEKP